MNVTNRRQIEVSVLLMNSSFLGGPRKRANKRVVATVCIDLLAASNKGSKTCSNKILQNLTWGGG